MSNPTVGPPAEGPQAPSSIAGSPSPSPYPSPPHPYPPAPAWSGPAQFGAVPPPMPPAFPRAAGVWQSILASAGVVLIVVADFWQLSRLSHQSALFEDIEAGRHVTLAQAKASDRALNNSVLLTLAVTVIALVFIIVWAYHARSNAERYTHFPFRRAKGWAIGAWICPIVNLWFPYQVVKDIWTASDTDRPDDFAVKAWPVNAVVPLWWTCLIAGHVVTRLSSSVYNSSDTASGIHFSLILGFASAALNIATATMFIIIVATITRFQGQRYDSFRAAAGAPSVPTAV